MVIVVFLISLFQSQPSYPNQFLAPHPLYFTIDGRPSIIDVPLEDKTYQVVWSGSKLSLREKPKMGYALIFLITLSLFRFEPSFVSLPYLAPPQVVVRHYTKKIKFLSEGYDDDPLPEKYQYDSTVFKSYVARYFELRKIAGDLTIEIFDQGKRTRTTLRNLQKILQDAQKEKDSFKKMMWTLSIVYGFIWALVIGFFAWWLF